MLLDGVLDGRLALGAIPDERANPSLRLNAILRREAGSALSEIVPDVAFPDRVDNISEASFKK